MPKILFTFENTLKSFQYVNNYHYHRFGLPRPIPGDG